MGGSQALSRSLFAQLIPKGREAEYFSVYEISDKGTSWLCPILFGLALQFTGSYRVAILSLLVFFAAGLLVLLKVDMFRGQREAQTPRSGNFISRRILMLALSRTPIFVPHRLLCRRKSADVSLHPATPTRRSSREQPAPLSITDGA